jgi:energy-coupling factor transporter ATP-binding protein EcfA2
MTPGPEPGGSLLDTPTPMDARSGAPALELDGVAVRYPTGARAALDLSLELRAGEILGVAGRTGAGKSTLVLTGGGFVPRIVHARVAGSVRIGGLDVLSATPAQLAGRAGIVFSTPSNQLSASKPTVREEIAFGLENLAVPRPEMQVRVERILERLGIGHLAGRDPFSLSGGEQQRVAIASVVAMEPGLLLLDEPTAQLDPIGTRDVADLLRQLAGEGTAILVAEHDAAILASSERCLVLDAGRKGALGAPGRVLASAVLRPIGLEPPTIAAAAELAGVTPDHAFNVDAVVAGLRRLAGSGLPVDLPAARAESSLDWAPIREVEPASISVRGLFHAYPGGPPVLRGLDLAVDAGSAVAIVGQNGSGKTTLAKHLNGLLRPDSGSVEIGGRDIRDQAVGRVARKVGYVFQGPDDQLFNRSVEREVAFGPGNLGFEGGLSRRLVDRAIDLAGLAEVRGANPYDLGLSIRKLVALASVLAMDAPVLVLDEPTTGQDGSGVARVGAIVESYRRAGRTVIAITHDMEFAAAHFDRVVVMRDGRIVDDGPPARVLSASSESLLASTGLLPPIASILGRGLGLDGTPTLGSLVAALTANR